VVGEGRVVSWAIALRLNCSGNHNAKVYRSVGVRWPIGFREGPSGTRRP
jgi:hypothetical protein